MNQWKFGIMTLSCAAALGVALSGLSAATSKAKSRVAKVAKAASRQNGKGRKLK